LEPRPRRIFLVHGEKEERRILTERLAVLGIDRVTNPHFGEKFELI
jgi:predicted metal-dependent RNase